MQSIGAIALQEKISNKADFLLIDVREPREHEIFNIGGMLIPMNTIFQNLHIIPKEKTGILYCQKGIRSSLVIQRLQQKYFYTNILNLSGGIEQWFEKY